ncbi:MAG: ABC transporter ATP-binding protein [Actinomyces urogenitalis]|uniref:ABC transporter ATP-binding protein n=1 Tax=Actinomyces urogenitalis TaxID=103621 RepID=UPI00050F7ADC|nr:ABC transporter ATP-binding protein [Actinomyces urogenitalis]KGF01386.1 cobalamin ABC transporter ATPase [Actinomyces urogenitalis S6-C4]MBS5976974.1 ABC transporter ATP-binding protein [Actinomyces urogenitalis]MBS6072222.1 ABC transporter ATP-binding protein [Actinomyces urogenitalis]MDU0972581.1 ABC transporter ATP-binding protein [Actinomyces urogenitalis]MDU5427292.1 ABC transporter ATP-binding protein [Actinomyces urogenitalis]
MSATALQSVAGTRGDRPAGAGPQGEVAVARELAVRGLRSGYEGRVVVDGVDLAVPTGRITVIVGANACGKSTLLKTMARILTPVEGAVLLDGEAITSVPTRTLARRLGLLPQQPIAPEGITVADLVGRGRHPHQGLFASWTSQDRQVVEDSLLATGTAELADRAVDELSGGQRQRVWIAMALAQRTDVLLLDEPTTFLDLAHQVEVLDLLTDLNRDRGTTVVMVLHDINLAARYADHLVAMRQGRVVASGPAGQVLSAGLMREVFGLEAVVMQDPVSLTPLIVPRGRHHAAPAGQEARTGQVRTETAAATTTEAR